jgi:hypothetical protein
VGSLKSHNPIGLHGLLRGQLLLGYFLLFLLLDERARTVYVTCCGWEGQATKKNKHTGSHILAMRVNKGRGQKDIIHP